MITFFKKNTFKCTAKNINVINIHDLNVKVKLENW